MSNLQDALLGYFASFNTLRDELTETMKGWDTPVIVVFGPQNSGKSTLLERLAMMPMFPKGDGLCTRVPIRIRLRTGEARAPQMSIYEVKPGSQERQLDTKRLSNDLLGQITQVMGALVDDQRAAGRGVRGDRLIQVELWDPKHPNVDLLDLPGMVVAPGEGDAPDLAAQTYQLVLRTIDEVKGRAIFLAVREAGHEVRQSLTTKILNERPEMKAFSLGVLTKCDNSADKQIIKELDASSEWALGYGYVATMNEPLEDPHDLIALERAELAWFKGSVERGRLLEAGRGGCGALIKKLAGAYHTYLSETWAPNTLAYLVRLMGEREVAIRELGVPVGVGEEGFLEAVRVAMGEVVRRARGEVVARGFELLRGAGLWGGERLPQGLGEVEGRDEWLEFRLAEFLKGAFEPDLGLKAQLLRGMVTPLNRISLLPQEVVRGLLEGDHQGGEVLSDVRLARFPHLIEHAVSLMNREGLIKRFEKRVRDVAELALQEALVYEEERVILRDMAGIRGRWVTAMLEVLSEWRLPLQLDPSEHQRLFEDSSASRRARHLEVLGDLRGTHSRLAELFGEEVVRRSRGVSGGGKSGADKRVAGQVLDVLVEGVGFKMVYCPAGEFWMGSQDGVGYERERPRHRVKLSRGFWMGQTQVTQGLWEKVMGGNPSNFKGPQMPVEQVSWFDCVRFCNRLSELDGLVMAYEIGLGDQPKVTLNMRASGYRLPTEAEWEYAAKAGEDFAYAGSHDLNQVGWFGSQKKSGNVPTGDGTRNVALLKPNAFGLYDMSGNVWEWCSDDWVENYSARKQGVSDPFNRNQESTGRACRGGTWFNEPDCCRVAYRFFYVPNSRYVNLGLRLARSID